MLPKAAEKESLSKGSRERTPFYALVEVFGVTRLPNTTTDDLKTRAGHQCPSKFFTPFDAQ